MKFLLLLGLAGILLVLLSDFWATFSDPESTPPAEPTEEVASSAQQSSNKGLESELKRILSQVSGVGEVEVQIRFASSGREIYARNTSSDEEKTVEKGESETIKTTTRHNQESKVVILNNGGGEKAVTKQKQMPEIEGVLIVAQGAANSQVKADIMAAVERGLGVASHKIAILAKAR